MESDWSELPKVPDHVDGSPRVCEPRRLLHGRKQLPCGILERDSILDIRFPMLLERWLELFEHSAVHKHPVTRRSALGEQRLDYANVG
jgi:hypothetical protein